MHRSFAHRIKLDKISLFVISIVTLNWGRPFSKRYLPTYFGLVKSCFRANKFGLLFSLLLVIFIFFTFFSQGIFSTENPGKYVYAIAPLLLYIAFILHTIFHEWGHLFMVRKVNGENPKFIAIRGLRVTIFYAPNVKKGQRVVAAMGPVFGIVGAQIIALLIFFTPPVSLMWWIISLSGFLHLYSFFPWEADGKIIWGRNHGN